MTSQDEMNNEFHRFMECRRVLIGTLASVRANITKQSSVQAVEQSEEDVMQWMEEGLLTVPPGCGLEIGYKAQINHVMERIASEVAKHCIAYTPNQPQATTTHHSQPTNN